MGNRIKPNVLILALLGALVVITLAVVFPDSPAAVLAAGGALIGGFAAVMKELVAPDVPDEAPEANVPASVVMHLIDRLAPESPGPTPDIWIRPSTASERPPRPQRSRLGAQSDPKGWGAVPRPFACPGRCPSLRSGRASRPLMRPPRLTGRRAAGSPLPRRSVPIPRDHTDRLIPSDPASSRLIPGTS